jgi:hypothetical protein
MSLYAWAWHLGWGLTNQASAPTPVILDKNHNLKKEGNIPKLVINFEGFLEGKFSTLTNLG